MLDKSGRNLGPGDLVIAFRNKKKLEEMEYAIVVSEGKVYNGEMTYTVKDNSYKCALTDKELEIREQLYNKYFAKTNKMIERKNLARDITTVGQKFMVDYKTYIYLGKCSVKNIAKSDNRVVDEYTAHIYAIYSKSKYDSEESKKIVDKIDTYNKLDIKDINKLAYSYKHNFATGIWKSKISAVDKILDVCDIINWDIGSKMLKDDYSIKSEIVRLK